MKSRVAITGIGMISPYGVGRDIAWDNLIKGNICYRHLDFLHESGSPVTIGGYLDNFNPEQFIKNRKLLKLMSREAQLASVAAIYALEDSGITPEEIPPERFGIYLGTGLTTGELTELAPIIENSLIDGKINLKAFGEKALCKCSPLLSFKILTNMPVCYISILLNLKGPNMVFNPWSGQVAQSIGEAFREIQNGYLDYALAGGVDSKINPISLTTLSSLEIINKNTLTSSPFGSNGKGVVVSEGGALIILENMELAMKRGARIYAELIGYGQATDYESLRMYPTASHILRRCMESALLDAEISGEDIDYINTSANSHPVADKAEAESLRELFPYSWGSGKSPLINPTKAMTGDFIAGSSSFEFALSAMVLKEQMAPPTVNLKSIERKYGFKYTPEQATKGKINIAMTNSFEMGTTKVSFIIRRFL
ncbi:MAG: beta-ketoacyl-[acyl-carrier-protein] synthase family protein [bacterium]